MLWLYLIIGNSSLCIPVLPHYSEILSVCFCLTMTTLLETSNALALPHYWELISMYSCFTSLFGNPLRMLLFNLITGNASPCTPVWPHYWELLSIWSCLTSLLETSVLLLTSLLGTPLHVLMFDLIIGDSVRSCLTLLWETLLHVFLFDLILWTLHVLLFDLITGNSSPCIPV